MGCLVSRKLAKMDTGKVPYFTFARGMCRLRVCDVYDGDTITGIMRFRGRYEKFKIRMAGYDSPEMKPPLKNTDRLVEKAAAVEARDALRNLIFDKVVWGVCHGSDKYGRLLMTVFYKGKNINQAMLDGGYGQPYDGGKKLKHSFTSAGE